MNTNYNLSLTCKASYKDIEHEFTFDPYNDCSDMEQLIEMAELEITSLDEYRVDADGFNADLLTVEITDFDEVPEKWANKDNIFEFAAAFAECKQEIEVVEAALECGIDPSDIDEAYNGEYSSDADFAEQICEEGGDIPKDLPSYIYIDWERTARDIMYDYSEHNGHYFRNF